MNQQLLRTTNLISDMLDRSHLHWDTFLLRKQPVLLDLLVMDVDPERIGQVLINLLTNVVKFSLPARVVRLSVGKEQAQAAVQEFVLWIRASTHLRRQGWEHVKGRLTI